MDTLRSYFVSQDPQKKKDSLPPKAHFSIWYFVMALFLFSYLQQYYLSKKIETISYSQFKQYVVDGSLSDLTIGPETINGKLKGKDKKPDEEFITVRVEDPGLVKDLDEHKIAYSGHYESTKFLFRSDWTLAVNGGAYMKLRLNGTVFDY